MAGVLSTAVRVAGCDLPGLRLPWLTDKKADRAHLHDLVCAIESPADNMNFLLVWSHCRISVPPPLALIDICRLRPGSAWNFHPSFSKGRREQLTVFLSTIHQYPAYSPVRAAHAHVHAPAPTHTHISFSRCAACPELFLKA